VTDHPQHVVAVTAVVFDAAGRVLLVKGDRRGWEPPGGQVELGEDLFTALKREVREECGCEVEVGRLLSVNSNLGRPERGVPDRKRLILIKHSEPSIDPGAPPNSWELSEAGRRRSMMLAERLRPYGPDVVLTSEEPKATETARIVAGRLGLGCATHPRSHEHDRTGAPFSTQEDFERTAKVFFENPGELVWGNETAEQAEQRFSGAVDEILWRYPDGNVTVVAHGTVITLFVARHGAVEPFVFWKRLGLPSFCVLTLLPFRLEHTVFDL
jgi:broad specificity phosphatase PhoE